MHSDLHVKLKHIVLCQSVHWGPKKEEKPIVTNAKTGLNVDSLKLEAARSNAIS